MSYILEALKKSEEMRQQDKTVGTFHQSQTTPAPTKSENWKLPVWVYILIFLVLCSLPLFYFTYSPPLSPVVEVPQIKISPLTVQAVKEPDGIQQPEIIEQPLLESTQAKKMVTATQHPAEETVEVLEPAPILSGKSQPIKEVQSEPVAAGYESVTLLEELSSPFRESVPEFKLAGHVYSTDPQLRMILINNSIVREGDIVGRNFILDEITPDGVIMRSGERVFRLIVD